MTQEPNIKSPRLLTPPRKKRRWKRRLAWGALHLLVILAFLYFGVPFAVNNGWFNGLIQRKLSEKTGMEVRLQQLQMNGWSLLAVRGLEISGPLGKSALRITAQRGELGFGLLRIFSQPLQSITVAGVELEMRLVHADQPPATSSEPFQWTRLPRFGVITLRDITARIHLDSAAMIFEVADVDATEALSSGDETRSIEMNIRMKRFAWKTAQHEDSLHNATLTAHLTATRQSQLATLTASLGVSDFLGASIGATLSYSAQELEKLRATVRGADWAALEKRFSEMLPKDFAARQFTGVFALELEADNISERGAGAIRLTARGQNVGFTARLEGNDAQLSCAALSVEARADLDRGFRSMHFDFGMTARDAELAWRDFQRKFAGEPLKCSGGGKYDFDIHELSAAYGNIRLPSAVTVKCEDAQAQLGSEPKYGGRITARCEDLSALVNDWKPLIPLRSIEASGKFSLAATLEGNARNLVARGETRTDGASIRLQTFAAENAPDSVLRLFYALRDLTERTAFELSVPIGEAGKGAVKFVTKADVADVELPVAGEMEKLSGVSAQLSGTADLRGEEVVFQTARAQVADFVGAQIEAQLASQDKLTRTGQVQVTNFDLKRQWEHFRRLLPDFETTYAPSGILSATAKYTASKDGGERATVEFSGDKLTVVSSRIELPSGVEELKLRGSADLEFSSDFKKLKTAAKLTFADALVYHDKLFKDFTGREATVNVSAELDLEKRQLLNGSVEAVAKDVLKIRAEQIAADFNRKSFSARVESSIDDAQLVFDGLVKETYGELVPALKESSMSGKIALNILAAFEGAKGTVRGLAQLHQFCANVAGVVIENADGLVPLGITTDEEVAEGLGAERRQEALAWFDETRVPAHLTIGKLEVGSFTVSDTRLFPRIARNRLVLDSPETLQPATWQNPALDIPFLGGRFVIGELSTTNLFAAPRKLEATFALREVSAADFFKAVGLPQYHGTITSTPCRLLFTEDDLSLKGTVTAAICDGTISVSDVRFVNYLSVAPVVALEMEFRRLNLSEVTSKLDRFGVVHGILDGHARRVLVQQNRPYSLDLELRTVPTKGVRQLIDRDAVRSLLILSTGERQPHVEPLLIFGGIKYRVFGIKCQINDDEVLIQGVEQRGNRHVVFDSAPLAIPQLTIEVITGRPISYADLIARLKAAAEDAKKK